MKKKAIVIGGGPAGIMAAGTAAKRGLEVTLIEKNSKLGRKLAITGKGRCNITNACESVEELLQNIPTNPKFLYSAMYGFTNYDAINFFEDLGVETKIERGNRVFPVSDKAFDVVDAMKKYLHQNGVKVIYDEEVKEIINECIKIQDNVLENLELDNTEIKDGVSNEKEIFSVILKSGKKLSTDSVVIATGGASYTATGSTGDGYRFAEKLGHTIVTPKASLIPLEVHEKETCVALQGLSLKNVEVKILKGKKNVVSDFGEMMFAHFGLTGPIILSCSSHITKEKLDGLKLFIDLKPALDEETLDKRLQKDFTEFCNRHFVNSLEKLLPSKLIPVIVEKSSINPEKQVNVITKEERRRLVKLIKNFEFTIKQTRPINEAIITSGGVKVGEINPATMESKKVKGIFFAGEVIDVDGYTGGFNLQIAYSTGFLAGQNC